MQYKMRNITEVQKFIDESIINPKYDEENHKGDNNNYYRTDVSIHLSRGKVHNGNNRHWYNTQLHLSGGVWTLKKGELRMNMGAKSFYEIV